MGTVSISDHIFLIHILWACAISNQNREKTNVERAFSSKAHIKRLQVPALQKLGGQTCEFD